MSRIHPKGSEASRLAAAAASAGSGSTTQPAAASYTVWQRSSMGFQGTDGFSVYDAAGELAFRVDNYSRRPKLFAGEITLMDGHGAPLLSLTPQIISMHDQWNCYKAPEEGQGKRRRSQQLFSVRKSSVLQSSREAEVYMPSGCASAPSSSSSSSSLSSSSDQTGHGQAPSFWIEGCFRRRSCKIRRGGDGQEVARIARKKTGTSTPKAPLTLSEDVFSLVVQPNVDCAMIMAFIVVLDRICSRPYTPLICSS